MIKLPRSTFFEAVSFSGRRRLRIELAPFKLGQYLVRCAVRETGFCGGVLAGSFRRGSGGGTLELEEMVIVEVVARKLMLV